MARAGISSKMGELAGSQKRRCPGRLLRLAVAASSLGTCRALVTSGLTPTDRKNAAIAAKAAAVEIERAPRLRSIDLYKTQPSVRIVFVQLM